jgi:hypothetical protein
MNPRLGNSTQTHDGDREALLNSGRDILHFHSLRQVAERELKSGFDADTVYVLVATASTRYSPFGPVCTVRLSLPSILLR